MRLCFIPVESGEWKGKVTKLYIPEEEQLQDVYAVM